MYKRFLSLLSAALFLLTLAACTDDNPGASTAAATSASAESVTTAVSSAETTTVTAATTTAADTEAAQTTASSASSADTAQTTTQTTVLPEAAQTTASSDTAQMLVTPADGYASAGYYHIVVWKDGTFRFSAINSEGETPEETIIWQVYVMDTEFEDAPRYIVSAQEPALTGGGELNLTAGQHLYIYCSVNDFTDQTAPEGCAYQIDVVNAEELALYANFMANGENVAINEWYTYDIDGDTHEELIVRSGTCEADAMLTFYRLSNGLTESVGEALGGSHIALFGSSRGGGLFLLQSHMGIYSLSRVTLERGVVTETVLISEQPIDDFVQEPSFAALLNHGN